MVFRAGATVSVILEFVLVGGIVGRDVGHFLHGDVIRRGNVIIAVEIVINGKGVFRQILIEQIFSRDGADCRKG